MHPHLGNRWFILNFGGDLEMNFLFFGNFRPQNLPESHIQTTSKQNWQRSGKTRHILLHKSRHYIFLYYMSHSFYKCDTSESLCGKTHTDPTWCRFSLSIALDMSRSHRFIILTVTRTDDLRCG